MGSLPMRRKISICKGIGIDLIRDDQDHSVLRRNVIFVDSAHPIVKSDRHRREPLYRLKVGVGVRQ
jgi:hypothetical protein